MIPPRLLEILTAMAGHDVVTVFGVKDTDLDAPTLRLALRAALRTSRNAAMLRDEERLVLEAIAEVRVHRRA